MMILSAISKICEELKLGSYNPNNYSEEDKNKIINYATNIRVSNFLKKYRLSFSPKEFYNKIFGITEIEKCKYCGNELKFLSLSKGYGLNCGSKECIRKSFLEGNSIGKLNNKKEYDNFIINHLDLYKNIKFPFKDPYDGKMVKNIKLFRIKSFSKLDIFNEIRKCLFCKSEYIFNIFNRNVEVCEHCIKGNPNKYIEQYKPYFEIDFENFKLNLKRKKFSNEELLKLSKEYSKEQIYKLIQGNAIIYNNHYLERKNPKDNFRYVYNNIIEDDMKAICKNCGKEYIKFDKVIKNGKMFLIQCGAKYSCGEKQCYYNSIKYYEISKEQKEKQSLTLKEKIKNGTFSPNATNSWTHSRKFEMDGIKFRSSWEFLFYIIMCKIKKQDLEYEKIRIPYFNSKYNKERIYIVDFSDNDFLYEIKPNCLENDDTNQEKIKAAIEYCNKNNKKFKIINENFFKKYYNKVQILNYISYDLKEYCGKLWRNFE